MATTASRLSAKRAFAIAALLGAALVGPACDTSTTASGRDGTAAGATAAGGTAEGPTAAGGTTRGANSASQVGQGQTSEASGSNVVGGPTQTNSEVSAPPPSAEATTGAGQVNATNEGGAGGATPIETTPAAGHGGTTANGGTGNDGMDNGGAGNTADLEGTSSGVRLIGRVDTEDPAGPRFAWSGTGVIARFEGTSVGVRLSGGQQYTVVLDGTVLPKLIPSDGVTSIATELAAGKHLIELYRRTEANQGEAQFLGFELGDGTLLAPPAPPARRLEVVGDSITCGYGNEGADMSCPFSPDTENHYLTYAAISARELGAELSTVAWSGKGVVCNYGDEPTSCVDPMPHYYDRALPERPTSVWDFSKFQPHAVVINLGTNDFSTEQDPTQAQFEDAYVAFLEHIRSKYADAWILSTVGPLLSGSALDTARSYIANAVARRASMGDSKVKTFELSPTDPADGYGCDYHPSLATHRKMAIELTSELEATLGW